MTLVTILILAITVEALIEYGKLIFQKQINWKQLVALVIGVLLAVAANVDLFAVVGVTFIVPYVGVVLTGIIFSRGANYVADFLKMIQGIKSGQQSPPSNAIPPGWSAEVLKDAAHKYYAAKLVEKEDDGDGGDN